jgi:hypothetical protein
MISEQLKRISKAVFAYSEAPSKHLENKKITKYLPAQPVLGLRINPKPP